MSFGVNVVGSHAEVPPDPANNNPANIESAQSADSSAKNLADSPAISGPEYVAALDEKGKRSLTLALAAAKTAEENRGKDILVLDLRELTCMFDYFVIASGTSRRQMHAMSEEIDHKLEDDLGDERMGIEGYQGSNWILLDYGTVVIHLFDDETRDYYAIEKLWGEAKQLAWRELSVE